MIAANGAAVAFLAWSIVMGVGWAGGLALARLMEWRHERRYRK